MSQGSSSVWDKFDVQEYKAATKASAVQAFPVVDDSAPGHNRITTLRNRWIWRLLNTVATIVWLYALLKVFITDLDRWAVTAFAPSWVWILDYRFFAVLLLVTIIFLVVKRWAVVFFFAYILLFPLVVLVFWIPRLFYQRRSWDLFLGSLQVLWSAGQSIRFTLVACSLFAFSCLAVALDAPGLIQKIAVVVSVALWTWLIVRAVVYAVTPSKFVAYQQKIIGNMLDSRIVWNMTALPPMAKSPDVTLLQKGEVDRIVSNASLGLALYAFSALWTDKLNRYRKSGISVVFSGFAVVALVAQGLALFTVSNLAIHRFDSSQFEYPHDPGIATFIRYSLSSMFVGEIEALRPVGNWANVVSIVANFSSAVIVLVLIVSVVFSLKQGRDDLAAEDAIRAMRNEAEEFADRLTGEYRLPLLDLLDRIAELNGLFSNWTREILYTVVEVHQRATERNRL